MSQNKAFSTPFILAVLCIYFSYLLKDNFVTVRIVLRR
ncbi:hypothetical protein ACUOA5_22655, partial [Escherichia coli]